MIDRGNVVKAARFALARAVDAPPIGTSTSSEYAVDDERRNWPGAVWGPNQRTIDFLSSTDCRVVAEIGVYRGHTSDLIAKWLDSRPGQQGELHLYDFYDNVERVADSLRSAGRKVPIKSFGNSYKYLDSYNWSLGKVLAENPEPIYDYIYIDGAHSWAVDGFATLLCDRLLKPGGYLDFDDYGWTLETSASMNPQMLPLTGKMYSAEQIATQQVKMICDVLVRPDPRYQEVVANKIFQKTAV